MIIGLCGKQGAGKSYVAKAFAAAYPAYRVAAFADALKAHCAREFSWHSPLDYGYTGEDWSGPKTEKAREILCAVGNAERAKDPMVWVHALSNSLFDYHGHVIIQDVRYWNEINFCDRIFVVRRNFTAPLNLDKPDQSELEWAAYQYYHPSPVIHNEPGCDPVQQLKELIDG